jgi:hypothetical protein
MSHRIEEMRVDTERDCRVGVAELAGNEDGIVPLVDQQTRERVPEYVERDAGDTRTLARLAESPTRDVSMPDRASGIRGEDEIVLSRERGRETAGARLAGQPLIKITSRLAAGVFSACLLPERSSCDRTRRTPSRRSTSPQVSPRISLSRRPLNSAVMMASR